MSDTTQSRTFLLNSIASMTAQRQIADLHDSANFQDVLVRSALAAAVCQIFNFDSLKLTNWFMECFEEMDIPSNPRIEALFDAFQREVLAVCGAPTS
jgi:hypothetical protein